MYEIGQQVVCVKTHSQGFVKEGEIHTVKDLRLCEKCKHLKIDVGSRNNNRYSFFECVCGHLIKNTGVNWISHKLFRPLDDLYNTEIEELMNEVNERQPFEL